MTPTRWIREHLNWRLALGAALAVAGLAAGTALAASGDGGSSTTTPGAGPAAGCRPGLRTRPRLRGTRARPSRRQGR